MILLTIIIGLVILILILLLRPRRYKKNTGSTVLKPESVTVPPLNINQLLQTCPFMFMPYTSLRIKTFDKDAKLPFCFIVKGKVAIYFNSRLLCTKTCGEVTYGALDMYGVKLNTVRIALTEVEVIENEWVSETEPINALVEYLDRLAVVNSEAGSDSARKLNMNGKSDCRMQNLISEEKIKNKAHEAEDKAEKNGVMNADLSCANYGDYSSERMKDQVVYTVFTILKKTIVKTLCKYFNMTHKFYALETSKVNLRQKNPKKEFVRAVERLFGVKLAREKEEIVEEKKYMSRDVIKDTNKDLNYIFCVVSGLVSVDETEVANGEEKDELPFVEPSDDLGLSSYEYGRRYTLSMMGERPVLNDLRLDKRFFDNDKGACSFDLECDRRSNVISCQNKRHLIEEGGIFGYLNVFFGINKASRLTAVEPTKLFCIRVGHLYKQGLTEKHFDPKILDNELMHLIDTVCTWRRFTPGSMLTRFNDVYFIEGGKFTHAESTFVPGDSIGEKECILENTCELLYTAPKITDTIKIPVQLLYSIFEKEPWFYKAYIQKIHERESHFCGKIVAVVGKDVNALKFCNRLKASFRRSILLTKKDVLVYFERKYFPNRFAGNGFKSTTEFRHAGNLDNANFIRSKTCEKNMLHDSRNIERAIGNAERTAGNVDNIADRLNDSAAVKQVRSSFNNLTFREDELGLEDTVYESLDSLKPDNNTSSRAVRDNTGTIINGAEITTSSSEKQKDKGSITFEFEGSSFNSKPEDPCSFTSEDTKFTLFSNDKEFSMIQNGSLRFGEYLNSLVQEYEAVIIYIENSFSKLSRFVLDFSDVLLIVGKNFDDLPEIQCYCSIELVQIYEERRNTTNGFKRLLERQIKKMLTNETVSSTSESKPFTTLKSLNFSNFRLHHVLSPTKNILFCSKDFDRLARSILERRIGLVLSGGGARGLAHVGVIQALEEEGIPIDCVGGTSMGAFIGALYSRECSTIYTFNEAKKLCKKVSSYWRLLWDITYPVCSIFTGYTLNSVLHSIFKDEIIQNLWIEYFCVTTNLSKNDEEVHRNGILWRYVRASMSICGYLPPICDNRNLLVDGGYMNNVPADAMLNMHVEHIIAVDVGTVMDNTYEDYGDYLSGFYVIFHKLFGTKRYLSMEEIQYRLAYVSTEKKTRELEKNKKIVVVRPDLNTYSTKDFTKFDEIVACGYTYAKKLIKLWKKNGEFNKYVQCKNRLKRRYSV